MTPDDPDLADLALHGPAATDPALCRDADAVVAALARLVPPVPPPPEIRTRLIDRIARESRPFILTAAEGVWEDWLLPGLKRRILYVDRPNRRVTMLLRMPAGGRLPAHPHRGIEEVYILDGDLHGDDGTALRAGDYQRSEPGTLHVEQWTVGGCTALLIAPLTEVV